MKIYSYYGRKNICGKKIREARLNRHLSQSDLAAQIQIEGVFIERDSISRIEIGTRFIADYELKIFAHVLNVSIEWLLDVPDCPQYNNDEIEEGTIPKFV